MEGEEKKVRGAKDPRKWGDRPLWSTSQGGRRGLNRPCVHTRSPELSSEPPVLTPEGQSGPSANPWMGQMSPADPTLLSAELDVAGMPTPAVSLSTPRGQGWHQREPLSSRTEVTKARVTAARGEPRWWGRAQLSCRSICPLTPLKAGSVQTPSLAPKTSLTRTPPVPRSRHHGHSLVLVHTRDPPTSPPLHMLFPGPEMLIPEIPAGLTPERSPRLACLCSLSGPSHSQSQCSTQLKALATLKSPARFLPVCFLLLPRKLLGALEFCVLLST